MEPDADGTVVESECLVDAPADRVWQRVVTPEGINDELRPWMTMSMPRGGKSLTIDNVPVGEPLGRSWLRLFGVLPFDYDQLTIAALEPGRSFREESTMLSMSCWQHERSVIPSDTDREADSKTVVRDRITFVLRPGLRFATPMVAAGLRSLFAHRHRRLQRYFR
jgi:ligand-binding SRPBCC domain-containing protein